MQMPVIVLSDLDLGMNQSMANKFEYPDRPMDRGKILWEEDLVKKQAEWGEHWGRYKDIDGDGIAYRTVPGNLNPTSAYFCRGTGHDEYARYSEEGEVWEKNMERLLRKYETAKQYVPKPVLSTMEGARFGIISIGSNDPGIVEARAIMANEGIPTDYLRIRAVPFTQEVEDFIRDHERVYVVEGNRDGQILQLLTLAYTSLAGNLRKNCRNDGLPLSARWIRESILAQEEK
jgi:2-oxoglutarate ferredoxin oxidoreductase subunit alpha